MIRILLLSFLLLSACGVDGAPTRPGEDEPVQTNPGVTVSGDARMGVVGNL